MPTTWTIAARISRDNIRLRVRNPLGDELLHGLLPREPDHPRALLAVAEGLALWSGQPLRVVISADDSVDPMFVLGDSWISTSALVRFEFAPPRLVTRRLRLRRLRPAIAELRP